MFAVTFLTFLNLISVFLGISALLGWNAAFHETRYQIALLIVGWAIINYYLLVRNGRYKKIAERFEDEKMARRRWNLLFCWFYVTFSFGAAVVSALIA